ncbi:MAG: TMEM175 family protein [Bacteroidota bacterium]
MTEKNLELERLVFFSDAVVAIAITLLALDLKSGKTASGHLLFSDLGESMHKFAAFFLSFFIIAAFWKVHHEFFHFIKKVDNLVLWCNLGWLLFIVLLPFSSSLVSDYFKDTASNFVYSTNVLFITIFQNIIWDYVALRPEYLKENATPEIVRNYRIACNVAMVNAVIAMALSFVSPIAAFIILFTRLPMILLFNQAFGKRKRPREKK